MSFITGKPFIDKVLSGLEISELSRLQTLINNSSPTLQGTYRTYKLGSLEGTALTSIVANNGYFKYIALSYDPVSQSYLKGILCKVSNEYSFFSWEPLSKVMTGGVVTQTNYSPRLEQLTTEEFRRVLSDLLINGGAVEGYVTEEELAEKMDRVPKKYVSHFSSPSSIENDILTEIMVGDIVVFSDGDGAEYKCSAKADNYCKLDTIDLVGVEISYYSFENTEDGWAPLGDETFYLQMELESGVDIKTINSNSILGSGDLSVGKPLYRHHIRAGTINDSNNDFLELVFDSFNSVPYESKSDFLDNYYIFSGLFARFNNNGDQIADSGMILSIYNIAYVVLYSDLNYQLSNYDLEDIMLMSTYSSWTDTVTEL